MTVEQPPLFGDEGSDSRSAEPPFDSMAAAEHIARHARPPVDTPTGDSVAEDIGIRRDYSPPLGVTESDNVRGIEEVSGTSEERTEAKIGHPSMGGATKDGSSPADAARQALRQTRGSIESRIAEERAQRLKDAARRLENGEFTDFPKAPK